MEDKDTIDLHIVYNILLIYKKKIAVFLITPLVLFLGIAFVLPKQYESTVLVRVKEQDASGMFSSQASAAIAFLGGSSSSSPNQTYIEMMQSRSVLDPIIEQLDLPDKDEIDNEKFTKKYLKFENPKGTDLIEITAKGRTPEEAQLIAGGITSSFRQLLTQLNQSEQSLLSEFLQKRIATAKADMEKAEDDLEKFRQQQKIYVPDQQAQAMIDKLTDLDKKIVEIQIGNDTEQAKLQGVNEQLQKQNVAIITYNITDNPGIQEIRSNIIQKQIALIEMQQRYTDKNPNVVVLKKEIEDLNAKLKHEVSQSVLAGTNTLNPVHAGLLQEKAEAETAIQVGQAVLGTAKRMQSENEKEISRLSEGSVNYIRLDRQVKITQELYGMLIKSYEQTRIQKDMESMDFQVVDEANLPKKPSFPKPLLMAALGLVIGIFISFIYLVVMYTKKMRAPIDSGVVN